MSKRNDYDSSWDEGNDELWDQKYEEWQDRDWWSWCSEKLSFPFKAERTESLSSSPHQDNSFGVGHVVEVIKMEMEDDSYGIIVEVKEGRKKGYLPLCEIEVTSRENENFWPVREYVVWFANQ